MTNRSFFCLLGLLLAFSFAAEAKPSQITFPATVIQVQRLDAIPTVVGSNPTDAPLRSDVYVYEVSVRMNCTTYVTRYESSYEQPAPPFEAGRHIEVRPEKHTLFVSAPGGTESKLRIVSTHPAAGIPCGDR